jgi:hypothetical protein
MPEKTTTRHARRAVAGLIERYFFELKRRLAGETEDFWMRVETALDGGNARREDS